MLLYPLQSARAQFLGVSTVAMEILQHRNNWLLLQIRILENSFRREMTLLLQWLDPHLREAAAKPQK